jgi:hypothetical protein
LPHPGQFVSDTCLNHLMCRCGRRCAFSLANSAKSPSSFGARRIELHHVPSARIGAVIFIHRCGRPQRLPYRPATTRNGTYQPNRYRRSNSISAALGDEQLLPRAGYGCALDSKSTRLSALIRQLLAATRRRGEIQTVFFRGLPATIGIDRGEAVKDTAGREVEFPILERFEIVRRDVPQQRASIHSPDSCYPAQHSRSREQIHANARSSHPSASIDKIATLVPPPRTHRHRYYGVLGTLVSSAHRATRFWC